MEKTFDVIVIGGGHAGVEAAHAAAQMGSKTLLLTLHLDKIASMPCNPSIGGLGKGHIVYEVSALGGLMPRLCSTTYLQARMLNTRKGPAVQGLRLQIDKYAYSKLAAQELLKLPNLTILPHMAAEILTTGELGKRQITGVRTADGLEFTAPCVVVTTGTFMSGLVHVGRTRYRAGRRGEEASYGLSNSIAHAMGVPVGRLKTGTPPRLLRSSIDFSQLEQQENEPLDYLYEFDELEVKEQIPCFIAQTNPHTHETIGKNLHLSALYSGNIKGTGPRYCPSIEDKVGRYPDRTGHHVFIEPEGADIDEVYPAGLSTSLPLDVQYQYIRSMKGLENAVISKCGYAIEYDFIQPNNLKHTLETKTVRGLFLAGQLNGTTGYEEAAGQGIVAGINAHLQQAGKEPFILKRTESYIGIMIDDLIMLGADEPYRMFTSRAERRLLLRQDNVFLRLMPYGRSLGLISDELYEKFLNEKSFIEKSIQLIRNAGNLSKIFKLFNSIEFNPEVRAECKEQLFTLLAEKNISTVGFSSRALLAIHADIKYTGYIDKELQEVEKAERYRCLELPETLDYTSMSGLTKELQQKLIYHKPKTIAQAQLIQGMTPAAISILIFKTRQL
ncbi:tRNA uridine-5-carboxymethylaminomethyl(34) synthesis enzyme MnmG [Candidatus Dependentiae bacterium]|jgi:tRNA uridine 5-carboxymethylaminomethyl modification enzyme|nr:tRNA uridine-5-carboxymethylaminomethyl(34) synthesis enzyme MnmG [Candidatus Dependentiae bacterium]